MKKVLAVILVISPALILCSGCASTGSKEVGSLKNRVSSLEERQDALESRSRAVSTDITYISEVERSSPAPVTTISRKSLTGMTNKDVQTVLKNEGYYTGPVDGKIGPKTHKAITDFQAANKLKVDGVVGPQTKAALLKCLNG